METITENFFAKIFFWHFIVKPKEIIRVWKNFINFGLYFFSVPFLIKNIFSPWRKYLWQYPQGFDPFQFFEVLISNLSSRVIGFIMRLVLIILGIICEIIILAIGLLILLVWIFLPLIIAYIFYLGIKIL